MKPMINTKMIYNLASICLLAYLATFAHAADMHEEDEAERGVHNGRLLASGNFSVELAIVEDGIEPEFRAWAYSGSNTIDPVDWTLSVELTRLGGDIDRFQFDATTDYLRGQGVVGEPHSFDVLVRATYQGSNHQWQYESHEGRVMLPAAMAVRNNIGTAIAGPGDLHMQLLLYGRTSLDPQQVSHVSARYPGLIRTIGPALGDEVASGDIIATIEANTSLQTYDIRAPINGLVIDKHANPGEMTGNAPLLTIANYANLWVDFSVFPGDAASIRPGLPVTINMGEMSAESRIRYLNPGDNNSPIIMARVPLTNPDLNWSPGLLVEGLVNVEDIHVDLLIDNRALQTFRAWQVVFINVGEAYEIRPLTLGRTDGDYTEVLAGLEPGDEYVVAGSYLLKADLEKDGASHDH